MDETTITLRRACACAFPAVLEALAEYALQQTGPNRPRCAFLDLLRIENHMIPIGIQCCRQGKLQSWGLYEKLPCPGEPLGRRKLGVTTSLCPSCHAKAAAGGSPSPAPGAPGCCQTPCEGCDGDCCEELDVYFTYFPGFPLEPHEVRWFFFSWFGMHAEAQAALPKDYRNMAEVYRKHDAPPTVGAQPSHRLPIEHSKPSGSTAEGGAEPSAAADEAGAQMGASTTDEGGTDEGSLDPSVHPGPLPARCRGAGAPLLIANQFLLDAMRANPDLPSYRHLCVRWLELYIMQMGTPPPNVDKSFREAVRKCRARLKRDADVQDAA